MNNTYRNLFFSHKMYIRSANEVFQNTKISSKIFDFLGDDDIRKEFKPKFNKQILIYGRVQSGKTAKIMEYIKSNSNKINILIIQNSLSMLAQYEKAFNANDIKVCSVSANNVYIASWLIRNTRITKVVLIVMNNNHRYDALSTVFQKCKISQYSLIMDESDMYYKNLKSEKLYKKAHECVHVTATPFSTGYKAYFDEVILIPPKKEYISFNKLDIKFIPKVDDEYKTIMEIIQTDFLTKKQGIMLITIHHRVDAMKCASRYLSTQPSLLNIPVVILSSQNILYYNKKTKELPKMSVSEIISGLDVHQHIVFIANRLASRGINYSDMTYTRHLTHQIIKQNDNKTNFIQRCRILGNKQGIKEKLKLYCLNCEEEYFRGIVEKIKKLEENVNDLKVGSKPIPKPTLVRSKTV